MSTVNSDLVKPYWIRVGSGGLSIRDERDVVDFFFDRDELDQVISKCHKSGGQGSKRDLELVSTNKFGSSRCPPPYWTESSLIEIERAGGLLLIPGDWPEPRAGEIWEHMVPFKPQITPCAAGETEAKQTYLYIVQPNETPGDVAVKFGRPYEKWVELRQANHDDPDGFTRPAADSGACTFSNWRQGKRIKVPESWPDPPKSSPVWQHTAAISLGVVAAPAKDNSMHTRPYVLKKGDTPGTLSIRHGFDKERIFRANPQIKVVRDRNGERNPYQPHWRDGQRINLPVTAAGIVNGLKRISAGDVGYYTLMPCKTCGAVGGCDCGVGATPTLQKRRIPQVSYSTPQVRTAWDATHPNWNGSQIAYWSQRIWAMLQAKEQQLAAMSPPPPGATNALNACRAALSSGIGTLQSWLRTTFSTPQSFVQTMLCWFNTENGHPPSGAYGPIEGLWFAGEHDIYYADYARSMYIGTRTLPNSCKRSSRGYGEPTYTFGVGRPRPGTVGATGDDCTPYGAAVTDVKPYYYIVQDDDIDNFWKIPGKFNMPTTNKFWQQMRNANLDWVGGFVEVNEACVLASLYPGAKLKVPANWLEPKPGVTTEPIGGTSETCGAGQIEVGGQCVDLPPGVSIPTGGVCPTGTTNVGGLCIPTSGYTPPAGQACLPGTTLNTSTGVCEVPGSVPPVTPGVQPTNGACPTGMRKYSDGLCYVPGTQPSGVTPVSVTTKKTTEEGYPAWAWALLGLGAVAGVGAVAYYSKKRKSEKDEVEVEVDERA